MKLEVIKLLLRAPEVTAKLAHMKRESPHYGCFYSVTYCDDTIPPFSNLI